MSYYSIKTNRGDLFMNKITIMYLKHCPYCQNALKATKLLLENNSEFQKLDIEWIEESEEPEKVQAFGQNYYYVPTVFLGTIKKYEAQPGDSYETIAKHLEAIFTEALQ